MKTNRSEFSQLDDADLAGVTGGNHQNQPNKTTTGSNNSETKSSGNATHTADGERWAFGNPND